MVRRLVSVLVLAWALTSPVLAADKPTIAVYPRFQTATRATIRVTVIVPRDSHNRQVCVDIEGENYVRSSCWEHIGEAGAYQTVIYYNDLPAGHYSAVAEVTRVELDGRRVAAATPLFEFRIIGLGEAPDPEEP